VSDVLPVIFCGIAGLLGGGAYSLWRQGVPRAVWIAVAVLAILSLAVGVLYL
jgi:hypothetical protein